MSDDYPRRPTARKRCPSCGGDVPPDGVFCPSCGASIAAESFTEPNAPPRAPGHGTRDQRVVTDGDFVYPANPPKSTALCLLNLVLPGLAQILVGQEAKGVVILLAMYVLPFVFGALVAVPGLECCGGLGFVAWFGAYVAMIVDAYVVAAKLGRGERVRKWRFFPGKEQYR